VILKFPSQLIFRIGLIKRISIDETSMVKKGTKISDIQPGKPLMSVSRPEMRQQTNRNTRVSTVYPDSFFIDSHVLDGEIKMPFTLCLSFSR
jgi:hypothetical protein